jgi:hypothetical protein
VDAGEEISGKRLELLTETLPSLSPSLACSQIPHLMSNGAD